MDPIDLLAILLVGAAGWYWLKHRKPAAPQTVVVTEPDQASNLNQLLTGEGASLISQAPQFLSALETSVTTGSGGTVTGSPGYSMASGDGSGGNANVDTTTDQGGGLS